MYMFSYCGLFLLNLCSDPRHICGVVPLYHFGFCFSVNVCGLNPTSICMLFPVTATMGKSVCSRDVCAVFSDEDSPRSLPEAPVNPQLLFQPVVACKWGPPLCLSPCPYACQLQFPARHCLGSSLLTRHGYKQAWIGKRKKSQKWRPSAKTEMILSSKPASLPLPFSSLKDSHLHLPIPTLPELRAGTLSLVGRGSVTLLCASGLQRPVWFYVLNKPFMLLHLTLHLCLLHIHCVTQLHMPVG